MGQHYYIPHVIQKIFQEISYKLCPIQHKARFQDLLKIHTCVIAYHNPDDLRRSSLKQCEGIENSANHHVNKVGTQTMTKDTDMSKRANEIMSNERIIPKIIIITNKKLKSSGIQTHNNICNKKIIVRKEEKR